jgi:acylphosphatase
MANELIKKRLVIEGRVQGVGYRASFADRAIALDLSGWVRNCRDGSVEACVQGAPEQVELIIAWSKRGPPASVVHNVTVEETDELLAFESRFKILPTK